MTLLYTFQVSSHVTKTVYYLQLRSVVTHEHVNYAFMVLWLLNLLWLLGGAIHGACVERAGNNSLHLTG